VQTSVFITALEKELPDRLFTASHEGLRMINLGGELIDEISVWFSAVAYLCDTGFGS
jgi:hypothetical protein